MSMGRLDGEEPTVAREVSREAGAYGGAVAGVEVHAVPTGPERGSSRVLAGSDHELTFNSNRIGFEMLSWSTIPDDAVIVAWIESAANGSTWCEIPLELNSVLLFGPAAEHLGRNRPGLRFSFATAQVDQVQEHADQLGVDLSLPGRGEVHSLDPAAQPALVGSSYTRYADGLRRGQYPARSTRDDVLRAMVHSLAGNERQWKVGSSPGIDSRRVAHECITYAESIGRIPSVSELCLVAHVSERRLREAFSREYGTPPSRFFRTWALEEARRRLVHSQGAETVTAVAQELGFDHLGRFAARYRELHGESPSATVFRWVGQKQ